MTMLTGAVRRGPPFEVGRSSYLVWAESRANLYRDPDPTEPSLPGRLRRLRTPPHHAQAALYRERTQGGRLRLRTHRGPGPVGTNPVQIPPDTSRQRVAEDIRPGRTQFVNYRWRLANGEQRHAYM